MRTPYLIGKPTVEAPTRSFSVDWSHRSCRRLDVSRPDSDRFHAAYRRR